MSSIEDPIHFANVQIMILSSELRNIEINNVEDLCGTIGKLQTYMHILFQIKHQMESSELPGENCEEI